LESPPGLPGVVLHIGLHKTGTRFLQREVFRNLDSSRFSVNPDPLWSKLRTAMRNPGSAEPAVAAREAVHAWRRSGDKRMLVISEPHISGDMYSSHLDSDVNVSLIKELFPEAVILFFVRNQADWLQSAYRQQLVKGRGRPIEVFLNYYDGDFRHRLDRHVHGIRNVEALNLRFLHIYQAYATVYGPNRVYLFRQEDLRNSADAVKARLAEALGIDRLPLFPGEKTHNRSFSALAINLFFPGVRKSYPRPTKMDAGERKRHFNFVTSQFRRLRQGFIQHVFDRFIYHDWDLLQKEGMRERINRHYLQENEEIKKIAGIVLEEGPGAVTRGIPERKVDV
jgi:hypothetical protein